MARAIDYLRTDRRDVLQRYSWTGSVFDFPVIEHAKSIVRRNLPRSARFLNPAAAKNVTVGLSKRQNDRPLF
jgi:hypothetical protein